MSVPTTLEEMREMVLIPGGADWGVPPPNEDLMVGKYLVTQLLWESVMGSNPSYFKGTSRPVEMVSWLDCIEFCNKLSEMEGLEKVYSTNAPTEYVLCNSDSHGYRLPEQWDWVLAASERHRGFEYSGSDNPDEVAWTIENSNGETHPVGQKKCNGFGIYDMSGNVDEWCNQGYKEAENGPICRVYRGGTYALVSRFARVSCRDGFDQSIGHRGLGFRLFRTSSPS